MPQEMTEVPINANESFYRYVYCFTGMKKVPLQHDTERARGRRLEVFLWEALCLKK